MVRDRERPRARDGSRCRKIHGETLLHVVVTAALSTGERQPVARRSDEVDAEITAIRVHDVHVDVGLFRVAAAPKLEIARDVARVFARAAVPAILNVLSRRRERDPLPSRDSHAIDRYVCCGRLSGRAEPHLRRGEARRRAWIADGVASVFVVGGNGERVFDGAALAREQREYPQVHPIRPDPE